MDKKLKFCIIGRGSIGTRHLKNLQSLGYTNIVAFSNKKNVEKDKDWHDKYGIITLHDIQDLRDYKPDIGIIANPTSKHIEAANLALDLNTHIFMEKPLSHNFDGVPELKQRLAEQNRIFFQANCLRFHPAFIKIKEMIDTGKLGNIYFANIQCGSYFPDWHKDEDYKLSYAGKKSLGGGVVLTMQHEIDYAYWFFGKFKETKSLIKKVSDLEIDVEDVASIIGETENGQLVEIHLDIFQRPSVRNINIQGSNGSINYQYEDKKLYFCDFADNKAIQVFDFKDYDINQMYVDELKHFVNCIAGIDKPKIPIDEAIYTLESCLEILETNL